MNNLKNPLMIWGIGVALILTLIAAWNYKKKSDLDTVLKQKVMCQAYYKRYIDKFAMLNPPPTTTDYCFSQTYNSCIGYARMFFPISNSSVGELVDLLSGKTLAEMTWAPNNMQGYELRLSSWQDAVSSIKCSDGKILD